MSVLVIGGAGFIGSNIVHMAISEGFSVRILDNMYTGSKSNLNGLRVDLMEGDVRDPKVVDAATKNVDYVFHEAAASSSQMFVPDPREGMNINLQGFLNVLHYACRNEVDKVVYAMSSSAYGNLPTPWREVDLSLENCPNVYAYSLLARAFFGKLYSNSYGLDTLGLIYFSVYGAYEKAKNQYANVISQFLWAMMRNEAPVLYGDGNQSRDYVYASDVAEANLLAAKSKASGDMINIGSGVETTMNETVRIINELLNKDLKPVHAPNPIMGYCYRTLADVTKAKKVIGFRTKVSLEEGVRRLISFYSSEEKSPA